MNLTKIIQKQILRDYLFMTGFVDIDSQYFIEKIESQIQGDDNLNGKTNVKGGMTNWSYFAKDEKFWTPFFPIQDYLEENNCLKSNYLINEIWGVCEPKGAYTRIHNHAPALFGGVIYLNSSDQKLFFPDIKQEIKPEPGAFAIFSGFLNHYNYRNTSNTSKYALSFNAYTKINLGD
tara:strand:+ start:200 stop:730 length:531 start_codon:yes stop_codon:yes gene_type:complete